MRGFGERDFRLWRIFLCGWRLFGRRLLGRLGRSRYCIPSGRADQQVLVWQVADFTYPVNK